MTRLVNILLARPIQIAASHMELYRAPGLKGPDLEGCQNWRVPELEDARTGGCQNWRGARIGNGELVSSVEILMSHAVIDFGRG